MEEEQPTIKHGAEHLKSFQYKKGVSGNPAGRPAGKTLKEYTREKLAAMSDDEREEFLEGLDKKVVWEMSEGKAEAKTVLDATVEHIVNKEEINKALDDIITED